MYAKGLGKNDSFMESVELRNKMVCLHFSIRSIGIIAATKMPFVKLYTVKSDVFALWTGLEL